MEEMSEENVSLYEQVKKDKRPMVEMDITNLVNCSEPLFSWVTIKYPQKWVANLEVQVYINDGFIH